MPDPIVSLNEESLRADPARARQEDRRGDAERTAGRGGRRPRRGGALREDRRPRGLPRRALRAEARDDVRRGHDPHAQAQGDEVHHGDRRALPAPGDLGRGGDDRDVPRGRLHQAHRGRERDPPGLERLRGDRLQPEREGLRVGRGVEERAPGARPPLRLRGRDTPQEVLGRELRERRRDGGHRRERRRLPRGHRRRGGPRGVGRVLARVPLVAEVPRPARRAHVHRRQGGRHGRLDRRGLPRRRPPAPHRALLPERPREGAQVEAPRGRRDARGDPRHGVPRGVGEEGRRGRRRAGVHEARGGREGRPRWLRRDPDVHEVPRRPLEEDPHEQRHRAAEPRDPQANPRRGDVPRRELRPHARHRTAEVRRGERVGVEALPGRDAAGGVATPDGGPMGLSESAQES